MRSRVVGNAAPVTLGLVAALLLGACAHRDAPSATAVGAAVEDAVEGQNPETRRPNAVDYKPAFSNQTRAPGLPKSSFDLQIITANLMMPWAMEILPDGRFLITERTGPLRIVTPDGRIAPPVKGMPQVMFSNQGGLLDLELDPQFARNHVIYFTYAEQREGGSGTTLARATLVEDAEGAHLDNLQVIFRQMPTIASERQYGSRVVFAPDGKLFLALGERGVPDAVGQAQSLTSDFGKVVRLNPDGSIPKDNPHVGRSDAWPQVWSYGHRDPQSAAIHPVTGQLWIIEHGPRGGDELNRIEPGKNYGWPVITYGIDYPGGKVGEGITQREGMEQPAYYWDPVIAPSGMIIYHGAMFPEWQGDVFVGGLVSTKLVRLKMAGDRVVGEEWLLRERGKRVRDVQQGPDGSIYVLTEVGGTSELLRLSRK